MSVLRMLGETVIYPERITEARKARGMSITDLAERVSVTRQALSKYEQGDSRPTGPVLSEIADVLHVPISFFTKKVEADGPAGAVFFRSQKSADNKAKLILSERAKWLDDLVCLLQENLDFPRANIDIPDISDKIVEPLTADAIEEIAICVRKYWGLGNGPISNIMLLFEKNGIIINRIHVEDIKTDACSQIRKSRPYIIIGDGKETAARIRFDLAHELGHILLHRFITQEEIEDKNTLMRIEREANRFAGAFLMPRDSFPNEVMSVSIDHFISLKRRWKASLGAMIYRCQDLELLSEGQILYLRKQMSVRRWNTFEPLDDTIPIETSSTLKKAISLLIEKGGFSVHDITDRLHLYLDDFKKLCDFPEDYSFENNVINFRFKPLV